MAVCGACYPLCYQRSSPEAQAGSARRRSTCSAAADGSGGRSQSAVCPPNCTTLASVHPLPTAASAAVLRGCCRSLSGGHGRLNWFVGKTRSYLCHRDTEFSALLGLSLCEVCRERQASVRQLAGTGGEGRDGGCPGEPTLSTPLFYQKRLPLKVSSNRVPPNQLAGTATCLSISPA